MEEVRRLTKRLMKSAREERVPFLDNVIWVPRPTDKGEIWGFNRCCMIIFIIIINHIFQVLHHVHPSVHELC